MKNVRARGGRSGGKVRTFRTINRRPRRRNKKKNALQETLKHKSIAFPDGKESSLRSWFLISLKHNKQTKSTHPAFEDEHVKDNQNKTFEKVSETGKVTQSVEH